MTAPAHSVPPAFIVETRDAAPPEIWGLAPAERIRRSLVRLGATQVETLGPGDAPAPVDNAPAILFRGDYVFDERLVQAIVEARDVVLVEDAGGQPVAAAVAAAQRAEAVKQLRDPSSAGLAGVRRAHKDELAPAYQPALRKSVPAFLRRAEPGRVREIEDHLFAASYKGITDLVTKWVWPRPAAAVTRVLARGRVHPTVVTVVSLALAAAAVWLFATATFGLGLLAAWAMTFLDTVDGKLARVTLTSSSAGHVLDHGLDLIHPPFWWLAWGLGLGPESGVGWATVVVVAGYLVGRLQEGLFLLAFDMETHSWKPVDAMFRTITARRNPNLILLTVGFLGGRPDLGMAMVALWTLASLGFHAVRLSQAYRARRRGEKVRPWGA